MVLCSGCITDEQCPHCFRCNRENSTCVQVEPRADPLNHCRMHCGTEMVCGHEPYCVHVRTPVCRCDWLSGLCLAPDAPPIGSLPPAYVEEEEKRQKIEDKKHEIYVASIHELVTGVALFGLCCVGIILWDLKGRFDLMKGDIENQKAK